MVKDLIRFQQSVEIRQAEPEARTSARLMDPHVTCDWGLSCLFKASYCSFPSILIGLLHVGQRVISEPSTTFPKPVHRLQDCSNVGSSLYARPRPGQSRPCAHLSGSSMQSSCPSGSGQRLCLCIKGHSP